MIKRYLSLDILRGIGILFVIFLHSSSMHYAKITKIDLNNPPLIVTVIGFLLMWAGFFALVSMISYTVTQLARMKKEAFTLGKLLKNFLTAGIFMIVTSYIYFILVAPVLLDFEHDHHKYSLISGFLHNGFFAVPAIDRVLYNTSLSMIGWNLVFGGIVLFFVLKIKDVKKQLISLGLISTFCILVSAVRIPLFPVYSEMMKQGQALLAFPLGLFVNKNDPILPYLGFALFGAMIGIAINSGFPKKTMAKIFGAIGIAWLVAGVAGFKLFPNTMLERDIDWVWFSIVMLQLGLFILTILGVIFFFDFRGEEKTASYSNKLRWVRRFGMVSLSVFFLETPLSEVTARIWGFFSPGWNNSMALVIIFALINLGIWIILVPLWERVNYAFSLEHLSAAIFKKLGRESAKANIKGYLYESR